MHAVSTVEMPLCWNCTRPITGLSEARYLYRGPQATTAIVEDWVACACGAFQNVRQVKEIQISSERKKA